MRERRRRRKVGGGLYGLGKAGKTEIARKFPYKLPVVEHLMASERKMFNLAIVFQHLNMRFKETNNGAWFEVIRS